MKQRIENIKDQIAIACEKSNRSISEVTLMGVSKFHTAQEVIESYNCGLRIFGENRVQEAVQKFPQVFEVCPEAQLHLIGSLQRNKVKNILPICSCIESLDRLELAQEIQKQAEKINKPIDVLFEYHTGEESKAGYKSIQEVCETLDYILSLNKSYIIPKGFMTMAPLTDNNQLIRNSFVMLRQTRDIIKDKYPMFDFSELSMGMSHDYSIAIEEGSTIVRIGTAIYGERNYQ